MADIVQLWENGPVFAQAEHFKFGTDSILLSSFVKLDGIKRGIDLGCASGIISLLLLCRSEKLHMTGLEIVEEAANLASYNMKINSLDDRFTAINGDIRESKKHFSSGSFDLVVANPPYYPNGSGKTANGEAHSAARAELLCSMEDLCSSAAYLCRTGGRVYFIHKAERMAELFCCMSAHAIEPKRLRLICNKSSSPPKLILVEGRRGGNKGLIIEPCLVLRNEDGSETDEVQRIYHRI